MQLNVHVSTNQSQKQQLKLSPEILQSLEILRMPLQELSELVDQHMCENPVLEMDAPQEGPGDLFAPVPAVELENEEPHPEEKEEGLDASIEDVWQNVPNVPVGASAYVPEAGVDAIGLASEAPSFYDMLEEQVGALKVNASFADLCRYLLGCLNRRGYFEDDPADIALALNCSEFDVMQALYAVQSLYPPGVGARSLQECLVLQLVESKNFGHDTLKLVKEGLSLLASNDMQGVAALLETDLTHAAKVAEVILSLNPIPSQGYYTGERNQSIIPDAAVHRELGKIHLTMNRRAVPRLEISREYAALLQTTPEEKTKEYLQGKMADAKHLIRAVGDREKTLERIIRQIIQMQPQFFEDGKTLVPMRLCDVAEALSVNISTVSRAIQGKYIVCAAGTVELKSLFVTGVSNSKGQLVAATRVKEQLQKIIEAEDPASPLHDEELREALQILNIEISRRTVAKYREELGIPCYSRRKKWKAETKL